MKKEDIKDAAAIAASAVIGSEIVEAIIEDDVVVDPVPCVYGPPPEYEEEYQTNDILDNDNGEDYDWMSGGTTEIDDQGCVYGPPPEIAY